MAKLTKENIKEPSIIVKPIRRLGGLDNIHVALIVLVGILVLLLLFISYTKQTIYIQSTSNSTANCTYSANGICATPIHNASQIKLSVEKLLASYAAVNGSISNLPYTANVDAMNVTYLPSEKDWFVSVPFSISNQNGYFTALVSDTNISNVVPSLQTVKPSVITDNYVISDGVVKLAGQFGCGGSPTPVQVDWFVDPYAPGGITTLSNLTSLEQEFGSKVNFSVDILFTQYYQQIANQYGANKSQALGDYLYCASAQGPSNFSRFVNTLDSVYSSAYVSPALLSNLSVDSKLSTTDLKSCLLSIPVRASAQSQLAQHYGIVSTPSVLTSCQYVSIPETAKQAICYANSTLCS